MSLSPGEHCFAKLFCRRDATSVSSHHRDIARLTPRSTLATVNEDLTPILPPANPPGRATVRTRCAVLVAWAGRAILCSWAVHHREALGWKQSNTIHWFSPFSDFLF
jgi:hypothetical protein